MEQDKIVVELSRKELQKMCDSCVSDRFCNKSDTKLVDCNLIFARKFKVKEK